MKPIFRHLFSKNSLHRGIVTLGHKGVGSMVAIIVPNSSSVPAEPNLLPNEKSLESRVILYGGNRRFRIAKRGLDLALVALCFPLLLTIFVIIALAVKLESKGPVFYAHRRHGHLGKPFVMYKFRTMQADADTMRATVLHLNEVAWPEFKITNDPRITRVGRFLRACSLDELPQLWNVAKGEMSLVGPRASSAPLADYEPWQLQRLSVIPGIVGPAQLFCRHADFEEKCRREIAYIAQQSMSSDIGLLLKILVKLLAAPDGR
jgi:lipopolysaccharide/colanic/teichoic acid biosynthesis glycosyltransferase